MAVAERHVVELDRHGRLALVLRRSALDRVFGYQRRGRLARIRDVARYVRPVQVRHEPVQVVEHFHRVRVLHRLIHRIHVRFGHHEPRTVILVVHRQAVDFLCRVHARLQLQRPAARQRLRAFRALHVLRAHDGRVIRSRAIAARRSAHHLLGHTNTTRDVRMQTCNGDRG